MNFVVAEAANWSEEILKWTCFAIFGAVALLFLYAIVIVLLNLFVFRQPPRTKVYDKVAWYGDECPDDAGIGAYVPFGMLLGWLIEHQLVSEDFAVAEDLEAACEKFKNRRITGPEFYCELMDGVLTDDDLSDEGNRFVKWYINHYYGDFIDTLCGGFDERHFRIDDTWENYERISKVIDNRFDSWKRKSSPKRDATS